MFVIGLDLGGTKLAGAVFRENGTIVYQLQSPLEKRKGKEVGSLIIQQLKELLQFAGENKSPISGVGISVPGISNQIKGTVWAPNIPGWDDYPLLAEVQHVTTAALKVESDRSCYILGETWKGAAVGCRNAIFLAVGTGIGAGILCDGCIIHGANDIAGAIGWLALDKPYLEKYKSCGCYEYHASGEGLARVARELLKEDGLYQGMLRAKKEGEITSHDIFEGNKLSDPLAKKVIDQAIEFWGMAAANLVSLFNPEKIIFGGGVFGPAIEFIPKIYDEAKKWAQPISITKVEFVASQLGGNAGLVGAGYLAIKDEKVKS